jgi:anti-anti-sigma factor
MEPLIVEVQDQDPRAVVVKVTGEVRLDIKPMDGAFLRVSALHPKAVVLDLTGMTFISSLGMGSIVAFNKGVKRGGGKVIACGTRPMVMDAFKRARLHEIFAATCEKMEEAMGAAG